MPKRWRVGAGGSVLVAVSVLLVCSTVPAFAQYSIDAHVFGGGGVSGATGSPWVLSGTIGLLDAGTLTGGTYVLNGGFWRGGATNVAVAGDPGVEAPIEFRLHPGAPNPVVQGTVIAFDLPRPGFVHMRVYDAAGRLTRTLAEATFRAGRHRQPWDGTDDAGHRVATGIYFVRFDSGTDHASRKLVVLR